MQTNDSPSAEVIDALSAIGVQCSETESALRMVRDLLASHGTDDECHG